MFSLLESSEFLQKKTPDGYEDMSYVHRCCCVWKVKRAIVRRKQRQAAVGVEMARKSDVDSAAVVGMAGYATWQAGQGRAAMAVNKQSPGVVVQQQSKRVACMTSAAWIEFEHPLKCGWEGMGDCVTAASAQPRPSRRQQDRAGPFSVDRVQAMNARPSE